MFDKLKRCSPDMKTWKNNVRFTSYASDKKLEVIGKVKLALKNMRYVVRGDKNVY